MSFIDPLFLKKVALRFFRSHLGAVLSHFSIDEQTQLISVMLEIGDPVIDSYLCEIDNILSQIKLNHPLAYGKMLTRLAKWFDYSTFLQEPTIFRQFGASQSLVDESHKVIPPIKTIFLTEHDKCKIVNIQAGRQISELKREWMLAHKGIADTLMSHFDMVDEAYNMRELRDQYQRVLFRRVCVLEDDCLDHIYYSLEQFPKKIAEGSVHVRLKKLRSQ